MEQRHSPTYTGHWFAWSVSLGPTVLRHTSALHSPPLLPSTIIYNLWAESRRPGCTSCLRSSAVGLHLDLKPGQRYPQISLMIATETAKWRHLPDPHYAYEVRQWSVFAPNIERSSLAALPAAVNAVDLLLLNSTSRFSPLHLASQCIRYHCAYGVHQQMCRPKVAGRMNHYLLY